jgi:putative ABC transport system permease protein
VKLTANRSWSTHSRHERPLAWAQLSHQKIRLAVAMSGITFANVLIFLQLGFRALFTEGATVLAQSLAGDMFLLSPSNEFLGSNNFVRLRLEQASAIEGVKSAVPLYIQESKWAYSQDYKSFNVRAFAFNPSQQVWHLPELNRQTAKLNLPRSVLFDCLSRQTIGPIPQIFADQGEVRALLNNRRISVVGIFSLGNSFFIGEGNIFMSEANYANIFGEDALKQVAVGVLKLQPGVNPAAVKAGIKANVPGVEVLTREELIAQELAFQETNPAGTIFTFGAIMGFIVGVVIVYQVLYADVSDHLAEYATLKAMGYSNLALLGVIFQEAIVLAVLGFIPGFSISYGMYILLAFITRLELVMRPDIAIVVLVLTIVMCMASAAIASNKLRCADPADVF